MKQMPENILEQLNSKEQFVYCFHLRPSVSTFSSASLYLTAHNTKIVVDKNIYMPNSGLHIQDATFNDSSLDLIKISGIWEEGGIQEEDDISGYDIEIGIYFLKAKALYSLSQYICTSMIKDGLRFHLHLEPARIKLQQTLVYHYGPNCRAIFCDKNCGLDKSTYPEGTTCDKTFVTCCNKFNNAVNFRGEPFIPSLEEK